MAAASEDMGILLSLRWRVGLMPCEFLILWAIGLSS